MIDVLIEKPSGPGSEYRAIEWPIQTIIAGGSTRDLAVEAFVKAYNVRRRTSLSEEDFRFFGPINVTVTIRRDPDNDAGPWVAQCVAERVYEAYADSEDEVRAKFVEVWNATHEDWQDITDEHVDWHREVTV